MESRFLLTSSEGNHAMGATSMHASWLLNPTMDWRAGANYYAAVNILDFHPKYLKLSDWYTIQIGRRLEAGGRIVWEPVKKFTLSAGDLKTALDHFQSSMATFEDYDGTVDAGVVVGGRVQPWVKIRTGTVMFLRTSPNMLGLLGFPTGSMFQPGEITFNGKPSFQRWCPGPIYLTSSALEDQAPGGPGDQQMPSGISMDRCRRVMYLCVVEMVRNDVQWTGESRVHMNEGARLRWRSLKQGVFNSIDLSMVQAINGHVVECAGNACEWFCELLVKRRLCLNLD